MKGTASPKRVSVVEGKEATRAACPGWAPRAFLAIVLAVAPVGGARLLGQEPSPLYEKWGLSLGQFLSTSEADLQVGIDLGDEGTSIDLADDLGLETDEDVLLARVVRRFGRHALGLGYYKLELRSRDVVIDRTFEFQGQVFPVNAVLSASLEAQNLELAYTYWVLQKPKFGLGLSGGIVDFRVEASLDASFRVLGLDVTTSESADTELPVPMLGVEARGLVHPRILVLGYVRYLPTIEIENYEGQSTTASIGVEGRVLKHLRVGTAYELFEIDVEVDEDDFAGSVNWSIDGIRLYARAIW